jgi:uncharacterized protein YpmS
LDENYKHFPTLLIICVICSVIFFSIAFVISSTHQRKLNSKKNSIELKETNIVSNINDEEKQMESYLTDQQQQHI